MFANRKYIGEYRYNDVVIPDAIPAIVSKDLFERVTVRVAQNKHTPSKSKAPETYILTTKLFCGTCNSMFVGESANKPNGVIYRYYKCAAAKRRECNRRAFRKEWIEDRVVALTMEAISNDAIIEKMADDTMALLNEGNEMLPILNAQLKSVQAAIENIVKAIEQGVFTRSTKARLEELETEENKLKQSIREEIAKQPTITKEMILFVLRRFRDMDMKVQKNSSHYIGIRKLVRHVNYKVLTLKKIYFFQIVRLLLK
jgi:hypothetical protein